jgi:DNA primase
VPYISKSSIQEVTDRLDANAVVSDYLHLEKRGGRLWACCPFHKEKTASFTVNPDLKTYYCFGCHKGGTMINFIMEMDKLSFPDAVELLAKKAGVELVYENSGDGNFSAEEDEKKKKKEELFELYRRISGSFHHFLLKNPEARPAWDYIITRGINREMIECFGLGYSPADRYWLSTFLSEKGYSKEFLALSGLFSKNVSSSNSSSTAALSSFFSGRIIFPIKDQQGRNIAFGGRFLPGQVSGREGWEPPKYINSSESVIYKKGETLYALDIALPEIRRTKTAYIAEGYMDVIALHQAGITNALAPLGTAFTDAQVKLLQRWVEKVIFFFDSDEAGRAAANKGIYTCRRNGLSCAVVSPEAAVSKDPADILKDFGSEALQKAAKSIVSDLDFLIARAKDLYGNSAAEGKAKGVAFIFPYIALLDSEVARTACIEAAADAFGLLPDVVSGDYRQFASGQKAAPGTKEASNLAAMERAGIKTELPIRMNDEILLLIVVALDYVSINKEKKEAIFSHFRLLLDINEFDDPNAKEIYVALEECFRYGEGSMDELLARISSSELKNILLERSVSGEFSINAEQFVNDGIKKIKRKDLEHRQEEIIIKLRSLKKSTAGDGNSKEASDEALTDEIKDEVLTDEIRELLAEKMQVDDELNQMKQGILSCLN